jgi:hypothetical protein
MSSEQALASAILDALREQIVSIVHAELQKAAVITSDEIWASEREISVRFRIPVKTLQHWRMKNQGPPFHKHGRSVRYRLSEVEAWNVDRRSVP